MRLIDADALLELMHEAGHTAVTDAVIDAAPTVCCGECTVVRDPDSYKCRGCECGSEFERRTP